MLHLKRFATAYKKDRRGRLKLKLKKLNAALSFERTLDMREFVTREKGLIDRSGECDGMKGWRFSGNEASFGTYGALSEALSDGPLLYELYGVLIHAGSLEKGHYFALIKDVETNEWCVGEVVPRWYLDLYLTG